MRARRSRRALSISAMYSASTTGASAAATDIAAATAVLHRSSCGNRRSNSWRRDRGALVWFGAGDGQMKKQQGSCGFCRKGRQKREGEEESNGVEAWRKQGMSPEDSNVIGGEDLR